MKTIKGISASPGIAIGSVFLYLDESLKIPNYDIPESQISFEFARFEEARKQAEDEILALKQRTVIEKKVEEGKFLDSHLLMLSDPELLDRVNENMLTHQKNAEWVLFQVMEAYTRKLEAVNDQYLRERVIDFLDISKRIMNHLMYRERISLADLEKEVVLVTHDLLPSDALQMNKRMIKGIAMDAGGKTSHTAILARSFEIPAVLGLSNIVKYVRTGDDIIIDGNRGQVIVQPDKETLAQYLKIMHLWQKREIDLLTLNELPAETRDGKKIELKANIEVLEELESVKSHGADGIGLFRSEYLFLQYGGLYSEDRQYEYYSKVLKGMKDKPVTIRTLDVGGDKVIPDVEGFDERNPILGWRAVRFCLARPDIFKTQLKALLRASVYGNLRIMFPMISGIEELNNVLEVYHDVRDECKRDGIPFKEDIPIGSMLEVPSAALTADILARKVNFFSIGTNDLIQYTIAVDRGNERIAYLYEPFHPGVIRLIKMIVEGAHAHGIPVGMCGEMAGDPLATVILLGLGLDEYSMSPFGIPEIKSIIRSISMTEAEELVGIIMDMRSHEEIEIFLKKWMNERFELLSY